MLHVDVMDGHFVPNISIGPAVVSALHRACPLPLDVHLMISDPLFYAKQFSDAGAEVITFHSETGCEVMKTIDYIHSLGVKTGLVLKPKTPVSDIERYLPHIDVVMVMTVEPGFGGQSFMEDMLPKISTLRALAPTLDIEVDGGITAKTAPLVTAAGANILVAGSALFGRADYAAALSELKAGIS